MLILNFLSTNKLTSAKEIAEALKIGIRSIESETSILRKAGYITKESKDNRGAWVVLKKV